MHVCRRTLCVYSVYVLSRVYIQYIPGGIPGPPLHYLGSMMYRCLVTLQCTFHWSFPTPHSQSTSLQALTDPQKKKYRKIHWCHFLHRCDPDNPKKFQNPAIPGFRENLRFIRRNGRKSTFEWPKVVSEVSFPRFWGVVCIEKCFLIFVSVIGSAVFEMSRFARFYENRPLKSAFSAIATYKT